MLLTTICRRAQMGASLIEFALCAPVLLFLGLGIIQIGLIYHAKSILNYATFEAARKGAVNHAQSAPMLIELGARLGPVFGGTGKEESSLKAISLASEDILDSRFTRLQIINPTREAFEDWGIINPENGKQEIPNSHLRHRNKDRVIKTRSGVTLQDANLLRIKVTYGYKMSVPFIGRWIANTMVALSPQQAVFYKSNRFPLTSVATVRLQSAAWEDGNISIVASGSDTEPGADDSTSATGTTPVTPVPCDTHGLPDGLDDAALEDLMQLEDTDGQCGTPPMTIYDILDTGVFENNANTDCEPT